MNIVDLYIQNHIWAMFFTLQLLNVPHELSNHEEPSTVELLYSRHLVYKSAKQVWSGQVRSACVSMQQLLLLGWSGGMLPQKCLKFRGYEIASETIFGPIRCFSEARRQSFTCTLSAPLRRTTLVLAFWSFANLATHMHPSEMRLVRL